MQYIQGDIFQSQARTLVCPVNTVGVMGKGLALRFRQQSPELYAEYRARCQDGFSIGDLFLHRGRTLCFPTKKHWRNPSRYSWISRGLGAFVESHTAMGISSIAFPALGCGLGGLDFAFVRKMMDWYLGEIPIEVLVYEPA